MFVGRKEYLEELEALWTKRSASLVTCRGRRRIGKSTLIEEFARRSADHFLVFEGIAPRKGMSDRRQREHFCSQLEEQNGGKKVHAANWSMAFKALDAAIPTRGKTVLLLDEISWMGNYNPDFAGLLKIAWDRLLSKHDRLIVILCGSVSAWIADNILNSTGFVGRDSLDLDVKELCLSECVQVMGKAGERLSTAEKLDILAITGGVPKYLAEVRFRESVDENMRRMCFSPRGLLFREFEEIFNEVFGRKSVSRGKVLRKLADGPMSVAELAKSMKRTAGGRLTRILKELEYAGFISRDAGLNPETGEPLRQERFRICDSYTRFYFRYIEPDRQSISRGLYRLSSVEQLSGWKTVLGLQLETLVLNHLPEVLPKLGLERSLVLSAAPFFKKERGGEGLQIDLLIQTKRTALVVEIKRREQIGIGVVDEIAEKVRKLRKLTGLSIRTALIYEGKLHPRVEAEHGIDYVIPMAGLIDAR